MPSQSTSIQANCTTNCTTAEPELGGARLMRREVFFAPEPADPGRYLKLRGRRWHYVRRVRKHGADWDPRGTIQLSLRTQSLEAARIKRDEIEKADDLYWSGVGDGMAAGTAEQGYRSAKRRVLGLGFQYLTANQIAATLSIEASRGSTPPKAQRAVTRPPCSVPTRSPRSASGRRWSSTSTPWRRTNAAE